MKLRYRSRRGSSVLLATLLMITIGAVPAMAKKGAKGPPEDDPMGGYTCAEKARPGPAVTWESSSHFWFTMDAEHDFACVDVLAPAGSWTVTVTGSGATGLLLIPRDSYQPGDLCAYAKLRSDAIYGQWTLPLPDDPITQIPAATINACGTEYGEWIDGDLIMEQQPNIPHPLALHAFFRGKSQATATIHVDLPNAP